MTDSIRKKISEDERHYETVLQNVAEHICSNNQIKIILIAGGSCAGKTTTTRKLSKLITDMGRVTHTISLDDYYRNLDESVYLPDGTRDIETINSLRVDMIKDSMESLLAGRETPVPMFDFKISTRIDNYRTVTLKETEVVIVEGLHALNLSLFKEIPNAESVYKIYLYASAGDGADCRFVRRLVRDSRHRNSDALEIYNLWANIKANEKESIVPFRKDANVEINTFFPYERSILNDDAVAHLEKIEKDSKYYEHAIKLIEILKPVPQLTDDFVPENSLLREFM